MNEQKLAGQARAIKVNQWLSDLELERIRLEVEREQTVSSMHADQSDEIDFAAQNVTESNVSPNEVYDSSSIHSDMQSADKNGGPRANIDFDEDELPILDMMREEVNKDKLFEPMNLRFVDRKRLKALSSKVDKTIQYMETTTLLDCNNIMKVAATVVARSAGLNKRQRRETA